METRKMLVVGLLMVIVLAGGVNSGSAALQNGSFEEPVLGGGQDRTSTITNWVNEYSCVAKGSLYGGAPDGNQLVEVTGYLYQNTGIQLVEGATYTLSFVTRDRYATDSNNIGMMYGTDAPPSTNLNGWLKDTWVVTTGTTWTAGVVNYTCTPANAGKYLLVVLTTGDYSHYSLFDNVVVTSVPAAPTFSPDGGNYNAPQTVTITSTMPGAAICYTTDGSDPTESSTLYSGAITVDHTITLKARVYASGYNPSPITTALYVVLNGSFEYPVLGGGVDRTSTITNWTMNYYSYVARGSLYGGAPDGNQLTEVCGYLYQNTGIQLVEGATYTLTFDTRDKNATLTNNIGQMYATDAPPSIALRGWLADKWVTTGTTWATGECHYTCSSGNAGKYLLIILTTGGYGGYSLFDNVVVTSVPAAPTFSVSGGNYYATQSMTITSTMPGATIRYTTDGSDPTASSTLYNGAITVSQTTTLKARVYASGYNPSPITTALYVVLNGSFEYPVLGAGVDRTSTVTNWANEYSYVAKGSLYGGARDGNQLAEVCGYLYQNTGIQLVQGRTYTLTFDTRDKDATNTNNNGFMYTTNTPTSLNLVSYLVGISVSTGTTWAPGSCNFTCSSGDAGKYLLLILSNTNYGGYSLFDKVVMTPTPVTEVPVFSPDGGYYDTPQTVTITCATPGATIYYTTDGSDPTVNSTLYSGAITVDRRTTLKAAGFASGYSPNPIKTATYVMPAIRNGSFESPVIPSGDILKPGLPYGWNTSTPSMTGITKELVYGTPPDGNQVLVFGAYVNVWQNTGVKMVCGQSYTVSAYTRDHSIPTSNSITLLSVYADNSTYDNVTYLNDVSIVADNTTWTQGSVSYICDASHDGTYLMVSLYTDTYWVVWDKVELSMANGSFESPVIAGTELKPGLPNCWYTTSPTKTGIANGSVYGGSTPDGNQVLEFSGGVTVWKNIGISMVSGNTYTVSAYTRDNSTATSNVITLYSTTDNSRTLDNATSLNSVSIVADNTAWTQGSVSYTCDAGHAGQYLKVGLYTDTSCVAWDKVTLSITHPSDFGKKWVRSHDFCFFGDQSNDSQYQTSPFYTGCGFNYMYTFFADVLNQAPSYQLGKHVYLPYSELSLAVINHVNNTSISAEENAWYVSDEVTQAGSLPGIGRITDWLRQNRPNGLNYIDIVTFLSTDAFLESAISTIHPDALMYDTYPFTTGASVENTNGFFTDLKTCRAKAQQHGLPYFSWLQAFDSAYYGARSPSESETRWQLFATLAAGYQGIGYYWFAGASGGYVTSALVWDNATTALYNSVQGVMPEAKNLSRYLRFLTSTDYRFVPGPGHSPPDNISNWSNGAGGDPHITGITVNSSGTKKDGLIGLFTDDNTSNHYFLFMNMYRDPSLNASSATLGFTITFDNSTNQLYRIRRDNGTQETVSLTNHQLTLSLPGGTGDIFAYTSTQFGNLVPTGNITINSGDQYTSSRNVTLTLSASGGTGSRQMRFTNDWVTWSSWEAYATSKSWTLTSGYGLKTVGVQYKDSNGNCSTICSDNITLQ